MKHFDKLEDIFLYIIDLNNLIENSSLTEYFNENTELKKIIETGLKRVFDTSNELTRQLTTQIHGIIPTKEITNDEIINIINNTLNKLETLLKKRINLNIDFNKFSDSYVFVFPYILAFSIEDMIERLKLLSVKVKTKITDSIYNNIDITEHAKYKRQLKKELINYEIDNKEWNKIINHLSTQIEFLQTIENITTNESKNTHPHILNKMNPDYLSLSLENFLDSITNKKNTFSLTIGNDIFEGNLEEIKTAINKIKDNDLRNKLLSELKNKNEYIIDFELSAIEIYNYLEKITDNFNPYKTKLTLFDVESYDTMDFKERIYEESTIIYLKNGWEIPTKTIINPIDNKEIQLTDHEQMIKKTHIGAGFYINSVISILKKHLSNEKPTDNKNSNPHARYFNSAFSFKLFEKLINEINNQTKTKLVDCSFIYRQMQKDNYINEYVGEKEFRDFLDKNYKIELTEQLKTYNDIGFINNRLKHYKDCIELTKIKTIQK